MRACVGVACPSLVFLQDLYDRLVVDEVLSSKTIKVVVGNVGFLRKSEEQPQRVIAAAKNWAAQHESERLFFASLVVGNDHNIHVISNLLNL